MVNVTSTKSLRSASRSELQIWQKKWDEAEVSDVEALDDLAAAGADVLPLHRERGLSFRACRKRSIASPVVDAVLLGESHRVDAHQLAVVRVFEQGEEPLVHG